MINENGLDVGVLVKWDSDGEDAWVESDELKLEEVKGIMDHIIDSAERVIRKGDRVISKSRGAKGTAMSDEFGRGDRTRFYAGSKGIVVRVLWDDESEYDVPVPALNVDTYEDDPSDGGKALEDEAMEFAKAELVRDLTDEELKRQGEVLAALCSRKSA
ncbi:MAG: hypothetical protein JST59_16215 [Actinobacteria bacterium]|nr:hypothetical protein [Actinomycetota bacterium]